MPSSDPAQRFEDILANIARIEKHTVGIDDETAFEENHLSEDLTELKEQLAMTAVADAPTHHHGPQESLYHDAQSTIVR